MMTIVNSTWNAPLNSTTAENYRAWGQAMSQSILATGLAKTADTGQVDWATVPVPAGAHQLGRYEVYRLTDALQATAPILIRIDYGCGTAATSAGIRVQIGTGSDGAGNLTGVMFDNFVAAFAGLASSCTVSINTAIAAALPCMTSGDGAFLYFNWNAQAYTYNSLHFGFERSRDGNGDPTGEGIAVFMCGLSSSSTQFSKLVTFAYGSSTRFMAYNLNASAGLMVPLNVSGQTAFPMNPVSANPNTPVLFKIAVAIPGGRSWNLRHFLMPPTHADASLAPTFRTDPDGKGSKVYRTVPLGVAAQGLFGYSQTQSIPVAFMWAD